MPEPPAHVLLWQPVTSASLYITQVLRQRVASLMVRDLPAETTKEIRQRLDEGVDVEVSGYTLGGTLLRDLETLELAKLRTVSTGKVYWLEHVPEEGKEIGVAARRAVDVLVAQGNDVEVHTFCDSPIWQIHERDFAKQLLATTTGLLP